MTIECIEVSKEYIKESINVSLIQKLLVRNPARRIRNYFIIYPIWFAASILCMIWVIKMMVIDGSTILGISLGCLLLVDLIMARGYYGCLKYYRTALNADRHITFTFTGDGIEYDNHSNRKASSGWDSFQCMRVLKTGLYLIPKEESGFLYGFQIENHDRIVSFFKENNIEIKEI